MSGAVAYRAQGDALLIESQAKMRLADEYDAAQERREVAGHGGARNFNVPDENVEATAADLGLSRGQIHDARQFRNAEARDPGIVRRAINDRLSAGQEPTKAAVREAVHARGSAWSPADVMPSPRQALGGQPMSSLRFYALHRRSTRLRRTYLAPLRRMISLMIATSKADGSEYQRRKAKLDRVMRPALVRFVFPRAKKPTRAVTHIRGLLQ